MDKVNCEVLIIGAGMAGLTAAAKLHQAGKSVIVLEKARGIGGRLSTRRLEDQQWDHGGQYFTATDPRFDQQLADWAAHGVVSEWLGDIYSWDGKTSKPVGAKQRFVGQPKMNAPLHHLAQGIDIRLQQQASSLERIATGWHVTTPTIACTCQELILAIPSPQAAALIPIDHPLQPTAAAVGVAPCWTVMVHTSQPRKLPFVGLFVNAGPIGWVANNSSKPGRMRADYSEDWVIQATPEWSAEHLEAPADWVASTLLSAWDEILLQLGTSTLATDWQSIQAHRWRFARQQPLGHGLPAIRLDRLTVCGDWLTDGRIEGAYLSGWEAAENLIAQI